MIGRISLVRLALVALLGSSGCSGEAEDQICYAGDVVCQADGSIEVCNADGLAYEKSACGADQKCVVGGCDDPNACPDSCKDIICEPGLRTCATDNVFIYKCDHTGTALIGCGSCAASPINGVCHDRACISLCQSAQKTYMGCEYFAADLDNAKVFAGYDIFGEPDFLDAENSQFAVVVSNPDDVKAAYVSVTRGPPVGEPPDPNTCVTPEPDDSFVASAIVPPGGLHIFELPSRNIQGTMKGLRAYRVAANVPITAYQFNPLENDDVFSNDASLLLPSTAIGTEYFIMTREQTFDILKGFLTVVGVNPQPTLVTVTVTTPTLGGAGIPALNAGESFTTTLDHFEVLNIESDSIGGDLTGSHVIADQPVAVFGGSEASNAPNTSRCNPTTRSCDAAPSTECDCTFGQAGVQDCMKASPAGEQRCLLGDLECYSHSLCSAYITCCADHLEMQLFPISSWGDEYYGVRSYPRNNELDVWRIMASQPDTAIVLDPPVADVPVLGSGKWFEFETALDFHVLADKPILVAQFLAAQDAPGHGQQPGDAGTGDPAFMLLPPARQMRTNYVFLAPNRYAQDFVTIAAPSEAAVSLDGNSVYLMPQRLGGPIGATSWNSLRVPISDGYHELDCSLPCSVMVHGYDQYVSYGYPGGLDLEDEEAE
jgi:hypothetical protein